MKSALIVLDHYNSEEKPSFILGQFLAQSLEQKGISVKLYNTTDLIQNDIRTTAINTSDSIIFSFPLVLDAPPSDILELMELIWEEREKLNNEKTFALIGQTIFAEPDQNDLCIKMAKDFSEKMHFKWLGGLILSQSEAIRGKQLVDMKRKSKHIIEALKVMADDVYEGRPISQKACQLINKRIISITSYNKVINKRWKKQAKALGTLDQLKSKPYSSQSSR